MDQASLYDRAQDDGDPKPNPKPGTAITAAVETIDNDRAGLMLDVGVVR